jgi:hypothetical protein
MGGPLWLSRVATARSEGYRSYLKFDLSGITSVISGAILVLEFPTGTYDSPRSNETIEVYGVASAPDDYGFDFGGCAYHAFSRTVWNDLGEGALYGEAVVTASDEGSLLSIPLDSNALIRINTAIETSGEFAVGLRMPSLGIHRPHDLMAGTEGAPLWPDLCYGTPSSWTVRSLELWEGP